MRIDKPDAKMVNLYWSQNHAPNVIIVRCIERVLGRNAVEAKYIPLDISINAMQYLATLVPAHRLRPLI